LIEPDPDIILVAGGDGALHHTIYQQSSFEGIFLGKAMGTLNFLMNTFDDDVEQLHAMEESSINIFVSTTETISIYKNGEYLGEAANDVILGDSVNGYHTYAITTEDQSFKNFVVKGTGLCMSTALGSTAYNLNNGGQILPLDSKLWSITGVACNRFIKDILPSQSMQINVSSGRLFISGIDKGELFENDLIELKAGKHIKLGFLDNTSFIQKRVNFSHRFRREG
jgi:NAD kinase